MAEEDLRPHLFSTGKGLVITMINPNCPQGGSSSLIRNFLSLFRDSSYTVISAPSRGEERVPKLPVECLLTDVYTYRKPVRWLFWRFWMRRDIRRVQAFIDRYRPYRILVVYPHLYNCEVFLRLKLPAGISSVGYFHDTFVEGQLHSGKQKYLNLLHRKLLAKIDRLFVMNEGMRELYKRKYSVSSVALEHTFPEYERVKTVGVPKHRRDSLELFWGGNVVGYNVKSLSRLIELAGAMGLTVEIASRQSLPFFRSWIDRGVVNHTFYPGREEYMSAVSKKGFLLLALDWPDETKYHEDEVSTIFSTKAIEYLMAGVPIILHAPTNYFMSRFLVEHHCGYVISDRDKQAMGERLGLLLKYNHDSVIANAFRVAERFSPDEIKAKWNSANVLPIDDELKY